MIPLAILVILSWMTLSTVQQVTDVGSEEEDESDPTGDDAFSGDPTGEDSPNDSDDPSDNEDPTAPIDSSPIPIDQQPSAPASPSSPPPSTPIAPSSAPVPAPAPPNAVTSSTIEHVASTTSTLPSHTFDPAAQIDNSGSAGSGHSSSPGAIAGGIIGGLVGIAILGGIFFLCLRKKPIAKASTDLPQTSSSMPPPPSQAAASTMPMTGAGTSAAAAAGTAAMNPFNDPEKQLPPPPPAPQPQVVGFHAWNAASSSDMLASSAAHYTR